MAARTFAALETITAEPVGERQLKGFSRPMPVYAAGTLDEAAARASAPAQ
jgi:class 3 adenylate cyclase